MIEWFDDLKLGMGFKSGETTVTREDITHFTSEFDPQPLHMDDAAAEKAPSRASPGRDGPRD
jgi:acyl dehydratase